MLSTTIVELVAGIDEAGRGPLAGPVVAAAVILDPRRRIRGLRDSKLLNERQRDSLAAEIRAKAVAWSVGSADVEEIDRINILQATMLAMRRAFEALSVTLMQAKSSPEHLAATLAARSAVLLPASPIGTALGGPLTTALGPQATLGGSGLATVALGAVACVLLLARRRHR